NLQTIDDSTANPPHPTVDSLRSRIFNHRDRPCKPAIALPHPPRSRLPINVVAEMAIAIRQGWIVA
ncbi:MAG: hypothetical protein HC866_16975, partial [Leptolyngbyaceae cyanobacterium RU_5_1]|nr:hypothetical protein [Leptolyngbyaceae cyanobacterium RU_5_1]